MRAEYHLCLCVEASWAWQDLLIFDEAFELFMNCYFWPGKQAALAGWAPNTVKHRAVNEGLCCWDKRRIVNSPKWACEWKGFFCVGGGVFIKHKDWILSCDFTAIGFVLDLLNKMTIRDLKESYIFWS